MNAPVELPQAHGVCPSTARRLIQPGALLIDVGAARSMKAPDILMVHGHTQVANMTATA